jgi:hypothetical protein
LAHDSMGYYMPQTIRPPSQSGSLAGLLPPRRRLRYDPSLMTYTHWCCASHGLAQYIRSLYPHIPNYLSSHFVYSVSFLGLSVRGESLVCSNSFSSPLECSHCAISLFRRIQNIKKHKTTYYYSTAYSLIYIVLSHYLPGLIMYPSHSNEQHV